jgi:hypothetical protein
MDISFAKSLRLRLSPLPFPIPVLLGDNRPHPDGPIVWTTSPLRLGFGEHFETLSFLVTSLSQTMILGLPWLTSHNPRVHWRTLTFFFSDPSCLSKGHCSSAASVVALKHEKLSSRLPVEVAVPAEHPTDLPVIDIEILNARDFLAYAGNTKLSVFECAFSAPNPQVPGSTITIGQVITTKVHAASTIPLDSRGVPVKYKAHEGAFLNKTEPAPPLPPHREYDLAIELDDSLPLPPPGKIYPLSPDETAALETYVTNALARGWISPSSSPVGAPCFYVKKPNGGLRLCIDYRGLNAITKKNSYPLPLIADLFDELSSAQIFTRLDLPDAYHLVRIRQGDEWKTAFRSRFGTFEYNVVSFGLSNAPSAFQYFMNDILREFLGKFVVVYLDDILIYSKNPANHDNHVRAVLTALERHSLVVNPAKCSFDLREIDFLGHIISPSGVSMDPVKTAAIASWESPKNVKDVQVFLGFANYYRRFIWQFSKIVQPLTSLLRKDITFNWTPACNAAFEDLKN